MRRPTSSRRTARERSHRDGHGYDGTATVARIGVALHLPNDLAMEAYLRGDAALRGERWVQ